VGDSFVVVGLSHLDQPGRLYWQVARDQRRIAVCTVLRYQHREPWPSTGRVRTVQSLQISPKFIYGQDIQRAGCSLAWYEEVAGDNQVRGRGQKDNLSESRVTCSKSLLPRRYFLQVNSVTFRCFGFRDLGGAIPILLGYRQV